MGLGSEIRDPEKTNSGSRGQKGTRSRIPDPDPHHWEKVIRILTCQLIPGLRRRPHPLLALGSLWAVSPTPPNMISSKFRDHMLSRQLKI
jgi:hypothetical protein